MEEKLLITIDGPAASGKTSVSRELAGRWGCSWVSTGAFYRGIAYVALQEKVDLMDEEALVDLIERKDWEVCLNPNKTQFMYKGEDVTDHIYLEEYGGAASKVSQHPKVRKALLEAQRELPNKVNGLVAEGRDCGSVVFPDADFKVYLTAHSLNRAQRRSKEEGIGLEETVAVQAKRDQQDKTRSAAPLQVPDNAHVVDTSEMDLQQVVEHVDKLIHKQFPKI